MIYIYHFETLVCKRNIFMYLLKTDNIVTQYMVLLTEGLEEEELVIDSREC